MIEDVENGSLDTIGSTKSKAIGIVLGDLLPPSLKLWRGKRVDREQLHPE